MGFLFILIVGLIAGTISGIVGTGSSIMLMPVLVYEYGPKQAVPIYAGFRSMAHTVERSHRAPAWRVGTCLSLSHRVMAPMLHPVPV